MTELFTLVNDDLVPAAQASLLVSDLSIQRGYGIFDFFKTLGRTPIFLDDHLNRFFHSAARLRLEPEKTRPQLRDLIDTLRNKNKIADSGIRLTLTGGYSPDGYSLARPNLIITQTPLSTPITSECQPGISLVTWPHQRQMPDTKTIDYLMAIWCQPMLRAKDAQDVLYHHNGIISECPRSNFFIVTADNVLVTPAHNILKGVIRGKVLQLAQQEFRTEERDIHLDELQYAKEAFITSTTKHILPVTRIDNMVIVQQPASAPTSIAQQLNTALYNLTAACGTG
jgi:branched-chain amino acid aminotransferase